MNDHLNKYIIYIFFILVFIAVVILIQSRVNFFASTTSPIEFTEISFSTQYLPTIDTGHYALWGINQKNEKIFLKRFNYINNTLVNLNTTPLESIKLDGNFIFDSYEITVEKIGDLDEEQSKCILLSGKNVNNTIEFTPAPFSIKNLSGSFILASITDKTESTNEKSGIWFTNNFREETTTSTLNLSILPDCWIWAAYINYKNEYLRIGRFSNTNSADDFKDYSFATNVEIKVPGEDFLTNLPNSVSSPINLAQSGNKVIIAIEPASDSMRLKLKYEPFWPVLEYDFNGTEKERTDIKLVQVSQPQIQLIVRFIVHS